MREEIMQTYSHKFESPMAAYVYDRLLMNGDTGDDETDNGAGDWAVRYGRRILLGNDQGFVGLERFEDVDTARAYMVALRGDWETDDYDTEGQA